MMRSWTLLGCLALVGAMTAGPALADVKTSEVQEKPWRSIGGPGSGPAVLADVFETEPDNDVCPGDPYVLGDVYHGEINPSTDEDWITFSATAGDNIVAATDLDGTLPPVDTILALFESDCATQISLNDDGGPGLFSLIDVTAPYTGTYHLRITSFTTSTGSYIAQVTSAPPPQAPANNLCDSATPIPRCTMFVENGSTATATNDYDPGGALGCACSADGSFCYAEAGRDVTYRLDLLAGDLLEVQYTNVVDGAVYLVTDCADVPGSCVAGSDKTFTGQQEDFIFPVPGTGTYWLVCDSFGTSTGGAFNLTVTINCPVSVESHTWGRVKTLYR